MSKIMIKTVSGVKVLEYAPHVKGISYPIAKPQQNEVLEFGIIKVRLASDMDELVIKNLKGNIRGQHYYFDKK